jgi:hypothetical protein
MSDERHLDKKKQKQNKKGVSRKLGLDVSDQ